SFLPIVAELSDTYDPHTIAAAALQMIYDKDRPSWLNFEQDNAQYFDDSYSDRKRKRRSHRKYDRRSSGATSAPILKKRQNRSRESVSS
ncbi:MAG: ATP-dependent helicase, partial [Merismopedia sp. SIO2A8]|nr:ATP-dependent helicase [Merismopedia sp. SIO2A8]